MILEWHYNVERRLWQAHCNGVVLYADPVVFLAKLVLAFSDALLSCPDLPTMWTKAISAVCQATAWTPGQDCYWEKVG